MCIYRHKTYIWNIKSTGNQSMYPSTKEWSLKNKEDIMIQ